MTLTEADCEETCGLRIDAVVAYNYAKYPWDLTVPGHSQAEVTTAIVNEMAELLRTVAEPMPGISSAVAFVKSQGMRLAVASSSPMVLIEAGLARLGLDDGTFEVVCSA